MTPAERAGYEANQKQMAAETMVRSGNSGGSSVVPSDTQAVGTQASQASSPTYQLFKPPEAMTPAERAGYEANQKQMAAETMAHSGNPLDDAMNLQWKQSLGPENPYTPDGLIQPKDTQQVNASAIGASGPTDQLFKPPEAMTPAERAGFEANQEQIAAETMARTSTTAESDLPSDEEAAQLIAQARQQHADLAAEQRDLSQQATSLSDQFDKAQNQASEIQTEDQKSYEASLQSAEAERASHIPVFEPFVQPDLISAFGGPMGFLQAYFGRFVQPASSNSAQSIVQVQSRSPVVVQQSCKPGVQFSMRSIQGVRRPSAAGLLRHLLRPAVVPSGL